MRKSRIVRKEKTPMLDLDKIDLDNLKRKNPQSAFVGARIDEATKESLDSICRNEGVAVSALIFNLIKNFLSAYEGKKS
jgi:hypothetical protein